MNQFIFLLSLPVSLFSILNKVFLVLNKRSGWVWGALVGLSSSIYFFLIGLKILSIAEIGFLIVMIYGYITHNKDNPKLSIYTSIVLTFISLFLATLFFANYLTVIETISSLAFIWGGYFIANKKLSLGWLLFIIAHGATSFSGFHKGQVIFSSLQIVSASICVYGIIVSFKSKTRVLLPPPIRI